jgi:hypothetical protein
MAISQTLRPYQAQVGRAVLESVLHRNGLLFTVEMARQAGKNELSAQLELFLMTLHMASGGSLVKAAPTFMPQAQISMRRLKERLDDAGFGGFWRAEAGHIIHLGRAQQLFFSAEPTANVVGATASILLELDEAQVVDEEKFAKEFRPMAASANATTVLYGTPWDGHTLLEEMAQEGGERARSDGLQRHFRFDWEAVAAHNPAYRRFVEGERARLGEEHPLFRTQYRLLPVAGGNGLLRGDQRAQLQGDHPRQRLPIPGHTYVAGLDVAGEPWAAGGGSVQASAPSPGEGRDSTVLTIGELDFSGVGELAPEPRIRVVEQYRWAGEPHHTLTPRLVDLLRIVWRCRRVVVDATGLGAGVASFLTKALGSLVEPFVFTAPSKSRLGFELLAAINAGRLKMYAPDGSPEHRSFWTEVELAQGRYRPNQTMDFFVERSRGHDDLLMSLALLVRASEYLPRLARGRAAA